MSDDLQQVLDTVIHELHAAPVDLLSIGDCVGESAYLEHSRCSYLRTLKDVVRIADAMPMDRHQIGILEVGAFLGVVSCALSRLGFSVTSLDIPEFMANGRLNSRYRQYNVATIAANLKDYVIPCESSRFQLVIMCETLEHLNFNPLPVMAEVNRVLDANGRLYLSLPNQACLVNRVSLLAGYSIHNPVSDFVEQLARKSNMIVGIHWREYTADELQELVGLSGFTVVNHSFFTTHNASLPARVLYSVFPRLRPNQTLIAHKTTAINPEFHFSEATR